MKTSLTVSLAFLLWSPAQAADPPAPAEANALYEEGRMREAVDAYEALAAAAPDSPGYHYNLGNAYYRNGGPGDLGKAIASYTRAFELNPRDSDIRHNLDFALRRAGEKLVPPGTPAAFHFLFYGLSLKELSALHWICLWASLLLGSLYLSKESLQARIFPFLAACVVLWAAGGAWWGLRAADGSGDPAVVLLQDAEVRSGPSLQFPVSFKLPEGRRVACLDSKGDWVEIGVKLEGLKGWIRSDALEKI